MAGLLNEPSGGLLDWIGTPAGQGLLTAVAAGMAGARRGAPINSIGAGMLGGLQGYANAQDQQMQANRYEQQTKLFDAQMQRFKAQADAEKAAQEQAKLQQGYLSTVGRVTSPVIGAEPNKFDPMKWRSLGGSLEDAKALLSSGNWGKSAIKDYKEVLNPDGSVSIVGFDEFGNQVNTGATPFKDAKIQDFGGYLGAIDPVSLKTTRLGNKSMTPGEVATDNRARDRLLFDQGGGVDGGGASQAGLVKQYGKPPAGYRWKPDGSMEFVPGGPADQKAQLQKSGEGTVGSVVADLRDKYRILDSENAIVSENNKWGTNIGARIGSSGVGQMFGGAVGTKAQSARDSIAMTRPLLLQSIMKATGMSAKQMDSNAELKMYLATATDPTLGLQANMEALDRIEALYGGGSQQTPANKAAPKPAAPTGRTVVRTGTMNGRKVVQYSDGSTEYAD